MDALWEPYCEQEQTAGLPQALPAIATSLLSAFPPQIQHFSAISRWFSTWGSGSLGGQAEGCSPLLLVSVSPGQRASPRTSQHLPRQLGRDGRVSAGRLPSNGKRLVGINCTVK